MLDIKKPIKKVVPKKELVKKESVEKEKEKRIPSKDEIKFKSDFYELMFELDLYNKFKKTYKLHILNATNYGYYAHLYLYPGLSYDKLIDKIPTIQQNLKCLWIMKVEPFKEYAGVQIVLNPIDKNLEYKNPEIKPFEMFLGLSFSNKIQKTNINENCMFLLGGATGSGKTRFIYQVLLSWILSCTPDEVSLYLSDLAKNEYIQFKNVKHVKYYASELSELNEMMKIILGEFKRRNKLITQYREKGIATNIEEYNRVSKTKLSSCIVLIDEFSVLVPDKTDSKIEKELKEYILAALKQLSKLGRSLGIFTFIATQKTTREEIPPILKNMSAVRISFRANDQISSEVIMGNSSAMGLPKRVAVYSLNGGGESINYLYSPKLITEKGKLREILKPYLQNATIANNNSTDKKSDDVESEWKITRIPKGMTGMEYLKSLKNNKKELPKLEDDYNDYGSR